MKKIIYLLSFMMVIVLSACSTEEPKNTLVESVKNMNEMKGYKMDSSNLIEAGAFGFKLNILSNSHIELEKDGESKKILMVNKQEINGEKLPETRIYLSRDKIGTYNQNTRQWEYRMFDQNNGTDQEDKWLIERLLSLYNPESSINQFLDSQSSKKIENIGNKNINGVDCIGISVEIEAKDLMKSMGEFVGKASGTKEMGGLFETLANGTLKNTEGIYWIGKNDHYIHRYESSLKGSFGKIIVVTNLNGYNQAISMN